MEAGDPPPAAHRLDKWPEESGWWGGTGGGAAESRKSNGSRIYKFHVVRLQINYFTLCSAPLINLGALHRQPPPPHFPFIYHRHTHTHTSDCLWN